MKKTRFPALIAVLFLLLSAVSCGKSDGSTVMKLGGFDVRYDICKYALRAERASLEEKYGGDLPETDGIDAELREGALAFLRNVYAVLSLAQEHGLSRDDPTVRGEVKFYRYSNFADTSILLRTKEESFTINQTVTKANFSVKIGNLTLSHSAKGYRARWQIKEKPENTTYTYSADYTYNVQKTLY